MDCCTPVEVDGEGGLMTAEFVKYYEAMISNDGAKELKYGIQRPD